MIVNRPWGQYTELFQDDAVKVKELIIEPGEGISYQRHFKRSEIWFISKGTIEVKHSTGDPDEYCIYTLKEDEVFTVRQGEWHQAYNVQNEPCHIIEIQYGEETTEEDIERLEHYSARVD
jgi:mannose-6-phosphate isomerase-like protein (cupin superfamily)